MSALSFLSKKSWHTGLQQNQEAVWKAEKSALEERRKLDELRKERDREREIQELERLQEEAGGKKRRIEKVDWMYNAPASGSNIDKNELEDYLLGKKRVDKLLKADEGLKHSRGNQEGPIAEQKAIGTDRDVAAKVREDPMFAIRQQEQAAYQALLKDPVRLKAMKKAAGLDTETKEERRRKKEEKRRLKDDKRERYERPYDDRAGSSSRCGREEAEGRDKDYSYDRRERGGYSSQYHDQDYDRHYDDRRRYRSRSREDERAPRERKSDGTRAEYSRRHRDEQRRNFRSHEYDDRGHTRARPPPQAEYRHGVESHSRRPRSRSRSPPRREIVASEADKEKERQAKLATMQQNAASLTTSRTAYLDKVKLQEEESAKREHELREQLQRSKTKGYSDGKGSFLVKQQRELYGSGSMDLNERLKRSRDGLQRMDGD